VKKHKVYDSYALLLPVPDNDQIHQQVIDPETGINYGDKSLLSIELLFYGAEGLNNEAYFKVDTKRPGRFIKFISNRKKVKFARDIVPTIDPECFEIFRPIFEFVLSACPGALKSEADS